MINSIKCCKFLRGFYMCKNDSCSPGKVCSVSEAHHESPLAQIMFWGSPWICHWPKSCFRSSTQQRWRFVPSMELSLFLSLLCQKLWDESVSLRDTVPTLRWVLEGQHCRTSASGLACSLPFIISTPVAGKAGLPWQFYLSRLCFPLKRGLQWTVYFKI